MRVSTVSRFHFDFSEGLDINCSVESSANGSSRSESSALSSPSELGITRGFAEAWGDDGDDDNLADLETGHT